MSRKDKLTDRLRGKPADFTWDEAVVVMRMYGFSVLNGKGSARRFVHEKTGIKVFLHQPHPGNIVKAYAQELLLDGLRNSGEIT